MSEIIASTYELIGKLGSGGGGTVYLANHLRLGKKVVLKADKRKITTRPELLRREIDVLKELHHEYIPQVYDFFVENDTVFTVMDYIDGESIDKYLKRGVRFNQPSVIKWAIEILNALSYLHSPTHGDPPKGYVHSDIKPANIMLRPNGDICLIDFNISLAIGEENIVGGSPGYASPEHYGLDNSFSKQPAATVFEGKTATAFYDDATITMHAQAGTLSSSSVKRIVVPDARSDIYSLGATLYHLLSGSRPAKDAKEVIPLSKSDFSPPLVDIITKAMNPNPDLRYQTADEMLQAFYNLWDKDPRVLRHKCRLIICSALLSSMLIAGSLAVFLGLRQMERLQTGQVLAAQSADYLSAGDVDSAIDTALSALVDNPGALDIPYTAEAQLALTNALGVYELSDSFKAYSVIELPSAPFRMIKSPDETKLIVTYAYELAIYDIQTGERITTMPTLESALSEVKFLNESEIIYAGAEGLTAYDILANKTLWVAAPATAIAVSGDKTMAAAIYKSESKICFYDTSTGKMVSYRELDGHLNIPENDRFADAMRDVFELSSDGSRCAVSFNNGALWILDIYNKFNDLYIYESSDYSAFDGEFSGDVFAYSANGKQSVFGMVDFKSGTKLGELSLNSPITVLCHDGEIYISQKDTIVKIDKKTFKQSPVAYTENKDITTFDISDKFVVSATDNGFSVFSADAGLMQSEVREVAPDFLVSAGDYIAIASRNLTVIELLKLRDYGKAELLDYDPKLTHSEARISSDGTIMLFSVKNFMILEPDGSVRINVELPNSENIYDQQYRHDGDYLEVTYYSGRVVCYSAKDGKIISENKTGSLDESLDEQFETKDYIIKAPLHGTPEVISKKTGKRIAELKEEDYLTYVTEAAGYIIAQYVQTDGNFYGVLMNERFEEIAILPRLCDVSGKKLIFDFPAGNIKTSPIYSLDQLKEMAKNHKN